MNQNLQQIVQAVLENEAELFTRLEEFQTNLNEFRLELPLLRAQAQENQNQLIQHSQAINNDHTQLLAHHVAIETLEVRVQQEVAALESTVNIRLNQFQQVLHGFTCPPLSISQRNQLHRAHNRTCAVLESLHPIVRDDGQTPENFPHTKIMLMSLTVDQLETVLLFYGLQTNGNKPEQQTRLMQYISEH